ncbi:DUF1501 domain-containing protein [Mesorhizobium sp. f-mel]
MHKLTRRTALKGLALTSLLPSSVSPAASLDIDNDPRLLVVYLRGGLDALAAVPAHGDPHFAPLRGPLACPGWANVFGAPKLDSLFALHPALEPLLPHYWAGELHILPATAVPEAGKSHAAAQAALFEGDIDRGDYGWLGRASRQLSHGRHPVWRAGSAELSMDLLFDLALTSPGLDIAPLCSEGACPPGEDDLAGLLGRRAESNTAQFIEAAINAALALSAPDGPRIAMLQLSGVDSHVAQGGASGRLACTLDALARGLVSFAAASGPAWRKTAVLVITEFGRSVSPNSQGGTDHGTGSVTFLMGGSVAGARVGDRWPGLAPNRLHGGTDLAATTDLRSVVKALLTQHLGVSRQAMANVYPSASGLPEADALFHT